MSSTGSIEREEGADVANANGDLSDRPAKRVPARVPVKRDRTGVAVRTLRMRVKDKHGAWLGEMARAVNMVWNYCNELGLKVLEREHRFIGGREIHEFLNGASKEGLCIGSAVFQQVAEEYATRRKQFKKRRLAWRASGGARRALGWVPFKDRSLTYKGGQVHFQGRWVSLWDSYNLAGLAPGAITLRSGSFSQDARGRWYLNAQIEIANGQAFIGPPRPRAGGAVGIDLGLKDFAATSDGAVVEAQRFYRDLEPALAVAQRAGKKGRTRALHAKIANRRKDFLHKLSTRLVQNNQSIFVGDVSAQALTKTTMAKSVLDAGWASFRTMLLYKGDSAGKLVRRTNEAHSTVTCSACGGRTGPTGLAGLAVRRWTCAGCGVDHDRDVNAARNILLFGLAELARESAPPVEARQPAPGRADRKVVPAARGSNKDSGFALTRSAMAEAGHGLLVEGIPAL